MLKIFFTMFITINALKNYLVFFFYRGGHLIHFYWAKVVE